METFFLTFIDIFFRILTLAIIARILLSWFMPAPGHPLVALIYDITEPILAPLRRVIPSIGMIDITPAVALILLMILESVLLQAARG